jgi:hypothetical protein
MWPETGFSLLLPSFNADLQAKIVCHITASFPVASQLNLENAKSYCILSRFGIY